MHYYKFNVGDYASHTRHLSLMEDLTYRRLLDLAYTTENPISNDVHAISRIINMREYQQEITDILKEFFYLAEEGWVHNRVMREIEESMGRKTRAKVAANIRWENVKMFKISSEVIHSNDAQSMQQHCSADAPSIKNDAPGIKNDATHNPLPITHNPLHTTHTEFDDFWKAYPKKVGKDAALKSWKKLKPVGSTVLKALEWQKRSEQWVKNAGQYIPNPATYLNQGRWKDEPAGEKISGLTAGVDYV